MAERLVPGYGYVNDVSEATLYQRLAPGLTFVNETELTAAEEEAAAVFWVGSVE
jgi:hypothetical protein